MSNNHFSRKQRQLKHLVKQLNILLKQKDAELKLEISKILVKIKHLVSQLIGNISANRMKRILGTAALLIGISFANTANAQWFAYPIQDPFNLQDQNDEDIINPEFADIDNDGDLDYLAGEYIYTPGSYGYSLGFHFQENIGNATNPDFGNPVLNPFGLTPYTLTLPQLGIRQHHKFIDIDNDGDFDILSNVLGIDISSYPYGFNSDFIYYENIGTPSNPQFAAPTVNQFGLTASPTIVYTTFGDIDNDGDTDIIGFSLDYTTYAANFLFIENIGSPSTPNFTTPQLNVFGIPPNVFAFLTLEDIDTDGDLDIMFCEEDYYSTTFGYLENIGTASTPQYQPPPTPNPFGLSPPNWQAPGIPNFKDLDGDGDNDLILGTDDDFVSYFENVGTQQAVTYECMNGFCVDPGTGSGTYATLSACQLSCTPPVTFECDWPGNCFDPGDGTGYYASYNDCMNDCTMPESWNCIAPGDCQDPGDGSGFFWSLQDCQNNCTVPTTWNCDVTQGCIDPGDGSGLYSSLVGCEANCTTTSIEDTKVNDFELFPNPVNNSLTIRTNKEIQNIEIYDVLGRLVMAQANPSPTINVEQLKSGIYSITIVFEDNRILRKFTK